MNKEIDDKTRAEVLREYADKWKRQLRTFSGEQISEMIREDADSYGPPRPQIEPGTGIEANTLCEAEDENGVMICGYLTALSAPYGGFLWVLAQVKGSGVGKYISWLADIRPARTLGPTQVAVDVPPMRDWPVNKEYMVFGIHYGNSPGGNVERIARSISRNEASRMWEANDGSQ